MSIATLIKLSLRSILRNRMRSLLTTLGIIIGVSSVIIMVAVGEGSQVAIKENIASMGTNLLQVRPPRGRLQANRLTVKDAQKIRAEAENIAEVSAVTRDTVMAIGGSGEFSTTVNGVESNYLTIKNWGTGAGEFFNDKDNADKANVAVVGKTIVDQLFSGEDPLGKQLRLGSTTFSIVGVLTSKGKTGMGDDQDNVVMVPLLTALARLNKAQFIGSIEMSAKTEDVMTAAQKEVDAIMRVSHRLKDGETEDYMLFNQEQIIDMASSTAKTLTVLLGAIAGVSLLVGGIGIMNIMLVSVTERTREIGIRLSVGAKKSDILSQFLTEAVVLSLLGGLAGILISLGTVWALNEIWHVRSIVDPLFIFLSGVFAGAVGVFFGYYPARKASAMNPIDALRTE